MKPSPPDGARSGAWTVFEALAARLERLELVQSARPLLVGPVG